MELVSGGSRLGPPTSSTASAEVPKSARRSGTTLVAHLFEDSFDGDAIRIVSVLDSCEVAT
jgi:hypothetical protein